MNDNTPPQACPWLDRLYLFVNGGGGEDTLAHLVQGRAEIRAAITDACLSEAPEPGSPDDEWINTLMELVCDADQWSGLSGCGSWEYRFEDGWISLQQVGLRPGANHSADDRVAQLLEANNREVERRRAAEAALSPLDAIVLELGIADSEEDAVAEIRAIKAERDRLGELLNTPHTAEFLDAVRVEAAHQVVRWGAEHDADKTPMQWVWLIAHLVTKAATAERYGDAGKYLHHLVTAGASLANWHRLANASMADGRRPTIDGSNVAPGGGVDDGSRAGALS